MNAAGVAALVSALAGGSFAVVALALALRNAGLREELARVELQRDRALEGAAALRDELDVERASTADILARRRADVERLYDDLGTGPDRDVGARARRGIQRLLAAYGAPR